MPFPFPFPRVAIGARMIFGTIRKLLAGYVFCRPRQMPSCNLRSDSRFHSDFPISTTVFDGRVQVMGLRAPR
ncbi:TPA: hypothetical protein DCE37_00845 [Candidatus Latescibacteria bacterium]|nr:hypothetical protein [Candidatus Latescibacterota bacterium]